MSENKEVNQFSQQESYKKKLPDPKLVYVVDFFSGCGGMSWGFANTRQSHMAFKILAGIDIEEPALETYRENVNAPGIKQDIREIADDPNMLRNLIPGFDENKCRPLLFIGCAPCQGFSAHRKKDTRDDARNNLMVAFSKICAHFKPDAVVMENVPEIIKGKYSHYWDEAALILKENHYHLTSSVLDLSQFGVPQRRKRAVVLAGLTSSIQLPSPVFSPANAPTVRDAIGHLTPIEAGEIDINDLHHRAPGHSQRILERIRKTPADGGGRRSLLPEDQLDCHISVDNGKTPGFTDVYGRLRWDTPSVTITAKSSTPSCGRFLHPEQHRNISVREAAILQGFPQTYKFKGSVGSQYRQIGEAVPPMFSRFLAWEILDHFRQKPDDNICFVSNKEINNSERNTSLKVIDCFSGSGGLSLGFEAAGFESVLAFDTNRDAIETFRQNISKNAIVASVEDDDMPNKIAEAVADSDFIMIGGPPCQGFSQQRRGEDKDARNNLVISYANLIEKLVKKPVAVVLENVTYLDSPRGKKILSQYIKKLEKQGYKTFRHDLNSADFLVPQLRKRIIIVSIPKEHAGNYKGPIPLSPNRWSSLGETLSSMPDFGITNLKRLNHDESNEGLTNKRRIAFVDMGKGRLSIPEFLQLNCHKEYGGHLDVFGRLDWFSLARTITGGFDSFTRGEYGHPFFHRSITPREAARIQGFPDWFYFSGKKASVRQQIGNAVPPQMAFAIAAAIKNAVPIYDKPELCQY